MKKIQDILLYILFFSLNFEVWDPLNTNGAFSIVKLLGIFYFISIIPNFKRFIRIDRNISKLLIPLSVFFCLLTINNIFNINIVSDTVVDYAFIQWALMMVIIINHGRWRPDAISGALLSLACGSAVLMLLYNLGIGVDSYSYNEMGRATIFGDNQNSVGLRVGISTMIIFYYTLLRPQKINKIYKYFLLLAVPGMLLLQIQTGSRVALASVLGMFIASIFLIKGIKTSRKLMLISSIGLVLLIIVIYIQNSPTMMMRIVGSVEDGDLAGRDRIWKSIVPLISDNPIFGVGQTGYDKYISSVFYVLRSPHNVFLELMCYTGIIGLCCYLLFLWRQFVFAFNYYRKRGEFLCLLFFVSIAGVMFSGQILGVKLYWCLFACITSISLFGNTSVKSQK